MTRIDGQIWIDKKVPNRLKYYVNGTEYEVSTSQSYPVATTLENTPYKGMLVCLDNGELTPAKFPDNLDNAIGLLGDIYTKEGKEYASVIRNNTLTLNEEEILKVFDTNELPQDVGSLNLKGAPVFWFIGRSYKEGGNYKYKSPIGQEGKLTLYTPSGFVWGKTSWGEDEDISFNIGYDNLPTVGYVMSYTILNNRLTSITLDANFTGFEKTLNWSFPYFHFSKGGAIDYIAPQDGKVVFNIHHGLFPVTDIVNPRCFCDILAKELNSDTEYVVEASVDNYLPTDTTDGYTEIGIKTQEELIYNIHGNTVYRFDKSHR